MRRLILISSILILSLGFLSSCKRCRTCKYNYTYAGISETVILEEYCGTKKEVDAYRDQAQLEADRVDGNLQCIDN